MSIPISPLTPDQKQEIEKLLHDKNKELANDIETTVSRAFDDRRIDLIEKLNAKVDEAISGNQSIVLATVQNAGPESRQGLASRFLLRCWNVLLDGLIPIVATALLGFLVWTWQKKIERKVDDNTRLLEARLAQKQEYFKRKLDVVQDVSKLMATVYSNARTARENPSENKTFIESIRKLSDLLKGNFYLDRETLQALNNFWQAAIGFSKSQITTKDFDEAADAAEKQIGRELDIKNLSITPRPDAPSSD